MIGKILSASMMCANFEHLAQEIRLLDAAGVDRFHVDIMDGNFVDNFGLGFQDVKLIRKHTSKPIEAHLMILDPLRYLSIVGPYKLFDIIYIHPESNFDPATVLEKIRVDGMKSGIAINPGTTIDSIKNLLFMCDHVLILGVNPGHAGRNYQPHVDTSIKRVIELRNELGLKFEIQLDGACTEDRIISNSLIGVDGFVLGTSVLFNSDSRSYSEKIQYLRNSLFDKFGDFNG